MKSFWDWLAMGGYSIYVWSAYGLAFVILLLNYSSVHFKKKRTQKKLTHWFKHFL